MKLYERFRTIDHGVPVPLDKKTPLERFLSEKREAFEKVSRTKIATGDNDKKYVEPTAHS